MASYDNVQLEGPPNIATAGNYAAMLMQGLQAIPQEYRQGQDFQYQQRQRNLFQDGIPTDANGNSDYGQMLQKMIQSGGAPVAGQMIPQLLATQAYRNFPGSGGSQPTNTGPTASTAAASPANLSPASFNGGGAQPQLSSTGMDSAGAETVRSLAAGIGGPESGIGRAASMLGVSPDQPLSAAQEARARRLLGSGVSAQQRNPVPQPGMEADDTRDLSVPVGAQGGSGPISPAPTSASGSLAGAPAQTIGSGGAATNSGRQPLRVTVGPGNQPTSFDDRFAASGWRGTPSGSIKEADALEKKAAEAYRYSAQPMLPANMAEGARKLGDQYSQQAKMIREQLGQYNSPANDPSIQGQKGLFEGASKAKAERIGEVVKAGPVARQMVNTLDVMEDAINSARGSLTTGPGAESMLKIKQIAANLGVDVKGLPAAETIQKMNAFLASEAAKQMTQRPSQMEFKTFIANNPGLMNSVQGTKILIDVLRQTANQTIGLGRLGMNENNWPNWGQVEDRFYQQNPIRLPFSGGAAGGGQTQGGLRAGGHYQWTPNGLVPVQ